MALKATVAKLEDLDEGLREHYKEKDGIFYLDLEGFGQHPGAVTLKATANKLDTDKKALTTEVTKLKEKFGDLIEDEEFSVDAYNGLKAGNKNTPEAIAQLQAAHTAAVDKLKTKHAEELGAKDKSINELEGYIDNGVVNSTLKDTLLDHGVNPDLLDGAVATLRSKVKVGRDDKEQRVALIETDVGEMPVVEFVKEWVGEAGKPYLGKAQGPGGEGGDRNKRSMPKGNLGGDRNERVTALKSKFPELP